MTPEGVVDKIQAFLHHDWAEQDTRMHDSAYIAEKMRAGNDIWGRDVKIEHVPLSLNLPKPIIENRSKYEALGWIDAQTITSDHPQTTHEAIG
jgi:hypothetical protein